VEGLYAAYIAGRTGQSILLLAIKDGRLTGVDVGGMRYDGHVDPKPDGSGFSCRVSYTILPGVSERWSKVLNRIARQRIGSGGRNCVGSAGGGGAAETCGVACSGGAGTGLRNAAVGCGGGTAIL
jgi:hypothetical protein